VSNGTAERILLKSDNRVQDNRFSNVFNDRPVDLPTGVDPTTAKDPKGEALELYHDGTYQRAIDAQGNADCEIGQTGYIDGPLGTGRYGPHGPVQGDDPYYTEFNRRFAGGSHAVVTPRIPMLQGTTFRGVPNLRDVP
jgi:hypothetical protein